LFVGSFHSRDDLKPRPPSDDVGNLKARQPSALQQGSGDCVDCLTLAPHQGHRAAPVPLHLAGVPVETESVERVTQPHEIARGMSFAVPLALCGWAASVATARRAILLRVTGTG
jgi:hypothetical protein